MEPNTDRGIWSIIVILLAIVFSAFMAMLAPDFFGDLNKVVDEEVVGDMEQEITHPPVVEDIIRGRFVTFDTKGGNEIPAQNVKYGDKATVPDIPIKYGFRFVKWEPSIDMDILEDTEFVAQWERITFRVNFNTDGGSSIPHQDVLYESPAQRPANPVKEGYTFRAWSPLVGKPILENTTYKALWDIKKYTVTFDTAGGNSIPAQYNVPHFSKATQPANPRRTGYTFQGWNRSFNDYIRGNTTFTAKWEKNRYTVTYNHDNGTRYSSQEVLHNDFAPKLGGPGKTGHQFTGWAGIDSRVLSPRTVTAKYKINRYTVTFVDRGTTHATSTVNWNSKVSKPTNPTRAGYRFTGWQGGINDNITSNRTFTAGWTPNNHKVTVDPGNGQPPYTVDVPHGEKPNLPKPADKPGYIFDGYPSDPITGTANISAKWRRAPLGPRTRSISKVVSRLSDRYRGTLTWTTYHWGTVLEKVDYKLEMNKTYGTGYWNRYPGDNNYKLTIANKVPVQSDFFFDFSNATGNPYRLFFSGTQNIGTHNYNSNITLWFRAWAMGALDMTGSLLP